MKETLDIEFNNDIFTAFGRKLYGNDFFGVVFRELDQNSLDANATIIEVEWDGEFLTVKDNGTGIQHVKGLLNVIGTSIKDRSNPLINGGFGLAKMAIFCCKTWEFKSISGSFSTGKIYDSENRIDQGTIVTVSFEASDIPYNVELYVKTYLSMIDRNVEFYFNGNLVNKLEYETFTIGNESFPIADTRYNGRIAVRVNGLPTFYHWINNLEKTLFLDFSVTLSPYDEKYPLTSNRDSFIADCNERKVLESVIAIVSKKLETDKLESESIKTKIEDLSFKGLMVCKQGRITLGDFREYSTEFYAYKRYLEQIDETVLIKRFSYHNRNDKVDFSKVLIGLTDGDQEELGLYGNNRFFIKAFHTSKGNILSIAIHEYCHFLGYGMEGHDQNFSSALYELTGLILQAIFNGEFRK